MDQPEDVEALKRAQTQLLDSARAICREDIRLNGRLVVHGLEHDGADLKPADEAYLSLSARAPSDPFDWLSQTWWLSEVALADRDPERVRAAVAAIERSLDKVRAWLADQEQAGDPAPTEARPDYRRRSPAKAGAQPTQAPRARQRARRRVAP